MTEPGSSTEDWWPPDREVGEWAASGAMALTGREDEPPLGPPAGLVGKLRDIADALARATERTGRAVEVDPVALLGERAAIAGLERHGDISCGGATRLLRAADNWFAVALARPEDVELVPAWLERECGEDPWAAIGAAAGQRAAADLVERGRMLGLPVAALPTGRPGRDPVPGVRGVRGTPVEGPHPPDKPLTDFVVADLSALWAGPLCGALLADAGANVIKVESTGRPDGARLGPPAFFDLLNAAKRSVALDLAGADGRRLLRELLMRVDVVIEASRPRALEQLGIDARALVAGGGPRVWVSLTGYGCEGPGRDRVAFGDDAAVGGGLVVRDDRGPCFCADAIADPTAGLAATVALLGALSRGRPWLLDVSLAGVAVDLAGPTLPADGSVAVTPPRARPVVAPAPSLGADTDAVLADLPRLGPSKRRPASPGGTTTGIGSGMLLREVEVDGRVVDVLVADPSITAVAPGLDAPPDVRVVDGGGGALVTGLHDHHVHLLAMAAAARSVDLGPAVVHDRAGLARALRGADRDLAPGEWLRGVAYHESVAGDLDRRAIDAVVPDRPVRVQHRSGARWTLNTAAVEALGLATLDRPGIERDPQGDPTGRLHRADRWLRDLLPEPDPPDLAPLGRRLASYGVTGVTDATPFDDIADLSAIARAREAGDLPQRVMVMGGPELTAAEFPPGLERGPVKIVIDDAEYPGLDELAGWIAGAHTHGRNVAIHCVTRAALALAVAAWQETGGRPGDRVEHASVAPPELLAALGALRLTVVTQPAFVAERGDEYLAEVDPQDVPHLYTCRSLLDAGIAVGGSTDAPYGDADPWKAIAAATARITARRAVVGPDERITAEQALCLFLADLDAPGGPPRSVAPGRPADLCLLDRPLAAALAEPDRGRVSMTVCSGRVVFEH